MTTDLKQAAFHTLFDCLGVRPGEQVAVVADTETAEIGAALFEEALELETEALLMKMKPREASGQGPPPPAPIPNTCSPLNRMLDAAK